MNKFLTLTRVLLKSNSGLSSGNNKKHKVSLLILVLAFAPMIALSIAAFIGIYGALASSGGVVDMLAAMMTVTSGVMIFFGILYVISTYYFSDDVAQLITMPIPPRDILGAKFIVVCLYQYFIEAIVMLPCVISFGIMHGGVTYWIYSVITLVVMPVIPTVICSLISVILMAFGKMFRNKDRIRIFAGLVSIIFAVGINVCIQSMNGASKSSAAKTIIDNIPALHRTALAYPVSLLASDAMIGAPSAAGLLKMLVFLLVSAAVLALFLFISDRIYLRGVVGLTESMPSRRRRAGNSGSTISARQSAVRALAMKDWRIMLRTPSYMMNCVLSALVFPPMMVLILGLSLRELDISKYSGTFLFVGIASGIVGFFCIMNMASATAVSREGKNIDVSRYIPVPYATQVRAKIIPGLLMSFTSLVITLVLSAVAFRITFGAIAAIFLISVVALVAFNAFGLFVDIMSPKLDWEDENAAVKNNLNVGILLIVMMVLMCALPVPPALLNLGFYGGTAFMLAEYLILAAGALALLFGRGVKAYAGGAALEDIPKDKPSHKKASAQKDGLSSADNAKRKKKTLVVVSVVILAAFFGVFLFKEFTAVTEVQINSAKVEVKSSMESASFGTSDINEVYLKDSMPNASKEEGFNSGAAMRGTFTVDGLGKGHVYTQNASGPFLYVTLRSGGFYIFNYNDSGKTRTLYDALKTYAAKG